VPNCGSQKRCRQPGLKKNLFADLLGADLVQEVETLLGRQAVEDLDFEALEVAVRQQVLHLARKSLGRFDNSWGTQGAKVTETGIRACRLCF
jgi:hypothetical protein